MARTQEQRKAETRARLLTAASELFAAKGFHAVSADAVADRAERTAGALYAHFGSKEGLLAALVEAWESETTIDVASALDQADDTPGRLAALWGSFVHSPEPRAAQWMLLEHELWLYAARNPEASDGLATRYADIRGAMAKAFEGWADREGLDPPAGPATTATLVLALLMGLDMQRRIDPAAVPDDAAVLGLETLFGITDPAEHRTTPSASPARAAPTDPSAPEPATAGRQGTTR